MEIAVIRAMPNTPSALGAGAAGLCRGRFVSREQMELAQRIFENVGRTVVVDEKHMDAVTGLSASGPAYIYIIIEALAEAGVNVGLPRETATQWRRKPPSAPPRWCSKPAIIPRCSRTQ